MKLKKFYETGEESYLLDEFKPYREFNRYYYRRVVRIHFLPIATMKVELVDFYDEETKYEEDGEQFLESKNGEKIVLQQYFNYDDYGDNVIPTGMQKLEMRAVVNNELSGRYAESVIHNLFVDLCLLNPKSKFRVYFPKIIEKLLDKDIYNYTLLSG